ncbi:MAG: type III-B CRISPR module RAMP protein Cmr1 [bacterium]
MSNNRNLIVSLETVTPLFGGGADPRGAPELRSPAFRGSMRYWLRAALEEINNIWKRDGQRAQ